MNEAELLKDLQGWYAGHCDGDWEHSHGVKITTLDNPGWKLAVDIEGTELSSLVFKENLIERSPDDWVQSETKNGQYIARGGPGNLVELVRGFIKWASSVR